MIKRDRMKRHLKATIILSLQLFMFYIFPLFAGPTDAMGMVLLILLATLFLSLMLGILSDSRKKYLYPILVAAAFVGSVFIYYNESALIHSVWYLAASAVGLMTGSGIRVIIRKLK